MRRVRESKWIDWNQYVDELSFAQAFRQKPIPVGFDSNIGMLIDTARNGWCGADLGERPRANPEAVSTHTSG